MLRTGLWANINLKRHKLNVMNVLVIMFHFLATMNESYLLEIGHNLHHLAIRSRTASQA